MKVGLFGGTFDPIHYGHVSLAEQILEQCALDEVWFLVTPQNPWKQDKHLSADADRLAMVELALSGNPRLVASDYEFHLTRPSYSYQTLQHLRHDYPEHEFTIIIGGDNWQAFDHWAHYEEILQHHPIAVFPREGTTLSRHHFASPHPIHILDVPLLPVSSTDIRQLIAQGADVQNLVTPEVLQYIKKHSLYV